MSATEKAVVVVNGTTYDARTPSDVIGTLESARASGARISVHYGDTDGATAGRDWLEDSDVCGRVGRSTGPQRIPLLIASRRSLGGSPLLDHCIVRIRESAGGRDLYRHPLYHTGAVTLHHLETPIPAPPRLLTVEIRRDGRAERRFENAKQATRWAGRMGLTIE